MSQDFVNSPDPSQAQRPIRAPRIALRGTVAAVIQLENRRQYSAKLHTLSVTGGLLETSVLIDERSKVSLAFYLGNGQLVGKAQMLFPMPSGAGYKQPFRFTEFGPGVRQTLDCEIAAFMRKNIAPQEPVRVSAPVVAAPPKSGHGTGLQLPRFFAETL